ncbi:hypothetical protein [Ovoidimarina sediminis]|uniref:hypothetical protein n=1 Tax=Ovoidimarina sediminis TaxID=3079856 RepID=UPI00290EDDFE|nr:hypothetical protein [Rhodophyticola sp. MJ-SS7]MDU8944070.1 hypothetical protein [Rhodophyticola sp. MJ-SS7]
MDSGYAHPGYAESLAGGTAVVRLPHSGATLLARPVPGGGTDLAGPYPMLFAQDLDALGADLAGLAGGDPAPVSAVFVLNPFADAPETTLPGLDLLRPLKTHFLADPAFSWEDAASKHHRWETRQAHKVLEVTEIPDPASRADVFWALYSHLIDKRAIEGVATLSPAIIARHLALPGARLFEARSTATGETLGAAIWFEMGEVAYLHLQAQSPEGYSQRAGYALYAAAFEAFRGRVRWLDWGGAAGTVEDPSDGLYRFKKGWASATRQTWICGKILDPARYDALTQAHGATGSAFFPAYRSPRDAAAR